MQKARATSRTQRIGAFIVSIALMSGVANAGESDFVINGGGGDYTVGKVRSLLDTRFTNIVRQQYDFSCGSAALATLLTYHYNHPVKEMDILNAMYINGDQQKIRKEGFSMLDMKNYLESIGYTAAGYKQPLDKLMKVGIPAIALINKRGYLHFVVIQGVSQDRVAVGDPTLGLRIYTRGDFEKMWNGIIFVVLDHKNIAQAAFNTKENWSPNGMANFRGMLDNGQLGALTVNVALEPNFY